MPKEVIQRVSEIGRLQGAPMTLTFGDRHAREIEDNLTDLDDYSDDGSYQPSESSDEDDDDIPDFDNESNGSESDGSDDDDDNDVDNPTDIDVNGAE
jgi:hypothetical protein